MSVRERAIKEKMRLGYYTEEGVLKVFPLGFDIYAADDFTVLGKTDSVLCLALLDSIGDHPKVNKAVKADVQQAILQTIYELGDREE